MTKVGTALIKPDGLSDLVLKGLLAGAVGVAAMTLAEKVEQAATKRPNSYVPAHTLQRLSGREARDRLAPNWGMHWGQGMLLGPLRALMAYKGIRGPFGSLIFLNLRLLNDQTLENVTGAGSPPWTWPSREQVVDILHKSIYAFATGAVVDRVVCQKIPKDE